MAASYRFPLGGNPEAKLRTLQRKAAQEGVLFGGDTNSGLFFGRGLDGTYAREGSEIVVTINRTPLIYTFDEVAAMIGDFLRE